jgi:hypothetical protein
MAGKQQLLLRGHRRQSVQLNRKEIVEIRLSSQVRANAELDKGHLKQHTGEHV